MTEPKLYGLGAADPEKIDYSPFNLATDVKHFRCGINRADEDTGAWDTPEQAIKAFADGFAECTKNSAGKYLFVRLAPELIKYAMFEGGYKYRMMGRFTLLTLKEQG